MILIISHNSLEVSTEHVYDWITCMGVSCMRFNGADLLHQLGFNISIDTGTSTIQWNCESFDITKISAVWIRRWIDPQDFTKVDLDSPAAKEVVQLTNDGWYALYEKDNRNGEMLHALSKDVNAYLKSEHRAMSHYFFEMLGDKPTLGNRFYTAKDPNKTQQLMLAKEVGLTIPDTIITDSRKVVQEFAQKHERIICKNIGEIDFFSFFDRTTATYTGLLTPSQIEQLPVRFFPSLFQEAIEKEFEARVFFLDNQLYGMAIFSSADKKTEIDFRRYNRIKPNRTIPLSLPAEVEEKIKRFMQKAGLTTGSLDLICTKEGDFVFLEVNTKGQFGMVSTPCNYYLEKKVAEHLINMSQHGNNY